MSKKSRFTKIGANGKRLPKTAKEWEAVLDTTTGLMWSVEIKIASNWNEAADAAEKIKASGFIDWRLPTVEELFCIADRTRQNPSINTDYFPDTPSDVFWTSTVDRVSTCDLAWDVSFYNGYSSRLYTYYGGFVRACRASELSKTEGC